MKKSVKPSPISGKIPAPASKSMMQRAVAASLLANGVSYLHYPSYCNDSLAALTLIEKLGAGVEKQNTTIKITGGLNLRENIINCGESGLGIRMFTPIAALFDKSITLEAEGSLRKRPVSMLEPPLNALGVKTRTNNGFPPITVNGPLQGGETIYDGSVSSQILTGLLMALPVVKNDSVVHVSNLKSKPYVDMTLELLERFGIKIKNHNYQQFNIKGEQQYKPCEYTVEGDWSGAAFLLVAGAIAGEMTVFNLHTDSFQGDKGILSALESSGALTEKKSSEITIRKPKKLQAFEFDATDCPDLFPPLVALAAHCQGLSTITGVKRLTHKESNREEALKEEFGKLGIDIKTKGDVMQVHGGTIHPAVTKSHHDHRIAMAVAVAALAGEGQVVIEQAESVKKSYPDFYEDMKKCGAAIA